MFDTFNKICLQILSFSSRPETRDFQCLDFKEAPSSLDISPCPCYTYTNFKCNLLT